MTMRGSFIDATQYVSHKMTDFTVHLIWTRATHVLHSLLCVFLHADQMTQKKLCCGRPVFPTPPYFGTNSVTILVFPTCSYPNAEQNTSTPLSFALIISQHIPFNFIPTIISFCTSERKISLVNVTSNFWRVDGRPPFRIITYARSRLFSPSVNQSPTIDSSLSFVMFVTCADEIIDLNQCIKQGVGVSLRHHGSLPDVFSQSIEAIFELFLFISFPMPQ